MENDYSYYKNQYKRHNTTVARGAIVVATAYSLSHKATSFRPKSCGLKKVLAINLKVIALTTLLYSTLTPSASANNSGSRNHPKSHKITGKVYVSIKSKETNVRKGPGMAYPIAFLVKGRNMPAKAIQKEGEWTMVEMQNHAKGWVKTSFLSFKNRYGINLTAQQICRMPTKRMSACQAIATIPDGQSVRLVQCNRKWCRIEAGRAIKGWIPKHTIWGVDKGEMLN